MLSRRGFLGLVSLWGGTSLLGCSADGPESSGATLPPSGPAFPPSILRGSRKELEGPLRVVSGAVPTDMLGFALAVGALGSGSSGPLFTGDGMIYRVGFDRGVASLKTRMVRTDDFLLDEAAGSDADLGYQNLGMLRFSSQLGARNFANTALTPMSGGRLIASYDAGRPWELDPVSLDVLTPVGRQATWRSSFPKLTPGLGFMPIHMSTAHPAFDPDEGAAYLVNYGAPMEGLDVEPFVRVARWDTKSEPVVTTLRQRGGGPAVLRQSCHQMHVTRRHVILVDGAFRIEPEQMSGQDVSYPQAPTTTLYIVRKDALVGGEAEAIRVEIPTESAHFLVDREDSDERVTLMLVHQGSTDPSEWVRANDHVHGTGKPVSKDSLGMLVAPADLGVLGRYEIDLRTGTVDESKTRKLVDPQLWGVTLWTQDTRSAPRGLGTAFWISMGFVPELLTERIVSMYEGHPHRVVPIAELPKEPLPAKLMRIDHDGMKVDDTFTFPVGSVPFSPTFVPRKNGGRDEGYLVVFVVGPEGDELWIFSSSEVARGPLCRLRHEELDFGFTLHTAWLEDLVPAPRALAYRVDRADDYREGLAALQPAARDLAKRVLGI